ncbi:MAG: DUF2357 domain-containing protein [Candidatus Marinimicrobia bacterium]|nr:DUF2357 domain-containing protein [Candidatus Neomarinimicrobiota bacterium]
MTSDKGAEVRIPIINGGVLSIIPEGDVSTLLELSQEDARDNGEERVQLQEGCSYDYALPPDYTLGITSRGIVKQSKRKSQTHTGRIVPGIYVGRLAVPVLKNGQEVDEIAIEIRSVKTDYRSDYRKMLEDITGECTELLMVHSSPVTQRFSVDYEGDSTTLYQRFAFVKTIVDSKIFQSAVHRVIAMPVSTWSRRVEEHDIRRSRRILPKQLRQLASRNDRIPIPEDHPLRSKMASIPSKLTTEVKIDTLDTPENRFVKYALLEFGQFCSLVRRQVEKKYDGVDKLPQIHGEAKSLEERFDEYLNHTMFREVSDLTSIPLNSPVLQRKEGYREILRVWLMFDLAAKLIWETLDDEYQAGKRDVATLYEYWLFFKLLYLVKEIFSIETAATKDLIQPTDDGFGLTLKSGRHFPVKGHYFHKERKLEVQFSYNRTFGKAKYPASGSWTKQMRPDYTLSIWPAEFTEIEAERQELIVHIHFDAKYKIEGLNNLLSPEGEVLSEEKLEDELNAEKREQKEGTYKRADLLKMHAYKDAIRRTAGAYVLYPGTEAYRQQGFHEIIPGLGAFPIAPSASGEDMEPLREFLKEVVEHFADRASQREELSYRVYDVHKDPPSSRVFEALPETYNGTRVRPIADESVLIGYYHRDQLGWIKEKKLYNIRVDEQSGPLKYGQDELGANYLLLYGSETITRNLWRIVSSDPRLVSKAELARMEYTRTPTKEQYFVFSLEPVEQNVFGNSIWDVEQLNNFPEGRNFGRPFSVSMAELMMARVKQN